MIVIKSYLYRALEQCTYYEAIFFYVVISSHKACTNWVNRLIPPERRLPSPYFTHPKRSIPNESGPSMLCQGEHREFGNFTKTQGIWFAQVVNSLTLKVKDISIFAAKIPNFLPSTFVECNSHKSGKLAQGKFAVRQGKQGL